MENPGVLHDREDFGPVSGGKTFRDHGAGRGCGTGSTPEWTRLVMNHGNMHMMRRFLPVAARWERGSFSEFCLVPVAVHDNDGRSCNGLRRVIRLPSTGVGRTSSVALLIARCRALGVFRDRPLVSLCRQLSSAIRRGGDEQHGVGDGLARSGNRSVGGVPLPCGAGGEETRALEEITAAQPGGLRSPGPRRCRGTVRRGGGAGACGPR